VRDILLTLYLIGSLPVILISPFYGMLVYSWISLFSPHRLTYSFAHDLPFAMLTAVATLAAWLVSREPKKPPLTALFWMMVILALWTTFTLVVALYPDSGWEKWNVAEKGLLMAVVLAILTNSERRIEVMTWLSALSIAFYGVKGAIFAIVTHGQYPFGGPDLTQLADNNQLALGLCMVLPLLLHLFRYAQRSWVRLGLLGIILLNVISVLASYSRGGLLTLGVGMVALLWRSRYRWIIGASAGLALLVAVPFIPQQLQNRYSTIESYQEDNSANLRFDWWKMAMRIAQDRPFTGGGFSVFNDERVYPRYFPDADHPRDVHSIYFEMLGEHGYSGLAIFLILLVVAFATCGATARRARGRPELDKQADLARMLQVSIVCYAVGGALLTLATFIVFYQVLGLILAVDNYVRQAISPPVRYRIGPQQPAAPAAMPAE
jgi:probable O-glycosylation ligase (exosortase A-associated)